MKWLYWPFSADSADNSLSRTAPLDGCAIPVKDAHGAAADIGNIALFEEHEPSRHRQQRRDVGSNEALVLADSDDDRAAFARENDSLRDRAR